MSVFYTVFGVGVVVGGRRVCLFFTQCLVLVGVVVGGRRVCLFFTQCLVLVWWLVDGCVCFLHSVWCWCGGGW